MKQPEVKATIDELVDFIVVATTQNPLGMCLTSSFWPKEKKWHPTIAEFDDVGDYLAFVLWAGVVFKNKKYIAFARNQLEMWFANKRPDGWYTTKINPFTIHQKKQITVSLYDLQDAFLGMYEFYLLTKDKKYLQEMNHLVSLLKPIIHRFNGRIPNEIFPPLQLALPWKSANPAVGGIIAEHLLLLGEKKLGEQVITSWLETTLWREHHLVHQGLNAYLPFLSPYSQTKIMKENSNLIYAMLADAEKYRSNILSFVNTLLTFQDRSGGFYGYWDTNTNTIIKNNFDKTQNFTIIDLLAEIYQKLNVNEALVAAESCAKFWLSRKSPSTHLIPEYIGANGSVTHHIAKLDQSADFYSSLLRLYALTGKKIYLREAIQGAGVIKKYFGAANWWYRIVSTKTGRAATDRLVPLKDRPAGMNLTKYVGGALRFYLSLHEVLHDKHMFADNTLKMLSRDR